jgi:DNA-binding response OmpR family regulator
VKILVIEDNIELGKSIHEFLNKEGNVCELALTALGAEDKLLSFPYDLILLDLMLPDGNGFTLLKFIKENKIKSGVLIISARNALDDKINGLESGADDYLTKPFHLTELNARIKAIFRRRQLDADHVIAFHEIVLNADSREVKINDIEIILSPKEFELLLYFMINKNRAVTKKSIAEHLWGDHTDSLDNFDFVYQHVKNLRKKISLSGGKDYLSTVYGLGYKFSDKQ